MKSGWKDRLFAKDRWNMLIVFLIAFIPRVILNLAYGEPLRTPMDEMSTISTGAFFGGADFTSLTSYAGFYYGGGFTILFAPLFRIGLASPVIYQIMLITCSFLQSLIAPIAYYILKKGFCIQNNLYNVAGAIVCSFCVVTRSMEVYNEHMLIFICWCIAFLFVKLCQHKDNYKKKSIYSVILMFFMAYGLTVHSRFQILWIGMVLFLIIFYWIYKRLFIAGIPSLLSAVIFYILAKKFNHMVINNIWLAENGSNLHNTSTNIFSELYLLKNPVSWEGIACTIIGQSNTAFLFSGGFLLIGVVVLIYLFVVNRYQFWHRKEERIYGFKQIEKWEELYMALAIVFILCIAGTIFAQSIRWLSKIVNALTNSPYGYAYGYKAFTYVRYIGPLLGPVALATIGAVYFLKDHLRKVLVYCVAAYGFMQLFWLAFVIPHISKNKVSSEVFWPFSFGKISSEPIRVRYYLIGTLIAAVIFLLIVICYYKKKMIIPLFAVAVLLIYQYVYDAIAWDNRYAESYSKNADAGYEIITQLDKKYDLPAEIYVLDTRSDVQKRMYTYQFLFGAEHRIIKYSSELNESNVIVLCSDADYESLTDMGYVWTQLDDNEYVYIRGDKYRTVFEQEGYQFSN